MFLKSALTIIFSLFISAQVGAMILQENAEETQQSRNLSPSSLSTEKPIETQECAFCKIGQKTGKAHIFWESDDHLAFLNVNPLMKGSSFVIPKMHQDSYFANVPEEDLFKFMSATQTVCKLLDKKLNANRTAVMLTGLSVPHLHARLSPIHHTGNDKFIVSNERGEKASEEELIKMALFLKESDDSADILK